MINPLMGSMCLMLLEGGDWLEEIGHRVLALGGLSLGPIPVSLLLWVEQLFSTMPFHHDVSIFELAVHELKPLKL